MITWLAKILTLINYFNKKAPLTLGFFFIFCLTAYGQNRKLSDSLESVYLTGHYDEKDKLKILKALAIDFSNSNKGFVYSEQLIQTAQALDSSDYLFQGYLEKGNVLRIKGDLSEALASYFQAASIAAKNNYKGKLGTISIGIGDIYAIMGNTANGFKYYGNAIRILTEERDSLNAAAALLNAGQLYFDIEKLDSALIFTRKAEAVYKNVNYTLGLAYSLGNLGMIYAKQRKDFQAEENMNQAILLMEDLREYYPIAVYLNAISDIYLEKWDVTTALNYAFRSLVLAKRYGMKKEVGDAYEKLSKIYGRAGKIEESFKYYKDYITYKDSVNNITVVQQMADLRTNFEVSKKQIEVDLLNQQKKNQQIIDIAVIIALVLITLLAFGLFRRYRFVRQTNRIIEEERNRSETLLLNILPKETALELKLNGKVLAKKFDSATVLFADFKGFTHYAENLAPEKLVETVDYYFSRFDSIIQRYGLEKIKTIGDAYMCASGLTLTEQDHGLNMVMAAFEIIDFVEETKTTKAVDYSFDVRIGISTGPVVAGVVGTKKFAYDIWGDTVNIAARMESNSEPGRINISETTYKLIKDRFDCEYRGEIEAKNKGRMKMYFVNSRKVEALISLS